MYLYTPKAIFLIFDNYYHAIGICYLEKNFTYILLNNCVVALIPLCDIFPIPNHTKYHFFDTTMVFHLPLTNTRDKF